MSDAEGPPPGSVFPQEVAISIDILDPNSGVPTRREIGHVKQDGLFRVGRYARCDVALPRYPDVSSVAVAVSYNVVKDPHGGWRPEMQVRCRQGGTGSVTVQGGGDSMTIRKGAQQFLRADTLYSVALFTPAPIVALAFRTPSVVSTGKDRLGAASETLTWTLAVDRQPNDRPPWLYVAALAVLVDRYPDVSPIRNGVPLKPAKALQKLVETILGHSSTAYYQARLDEAARAAHLNIAAGDQTKQSRVAAAYAERFPEEKLKELRLLALDLGTLDA